MLVRLAAVFAASFSLAGTAGATEPAPDVVPLEDLFRNPVFYDVQISGDGRYLSAITHTENLPTARTRAGTGAASPVTTAWLKPTGKTASAIRESTNSGSTTPRR